MSTNPNTSNDDQEHMETLREVDQVLGSGQAGASTAEAFNPCQEYDKIRNLLPKVIKLAEKIPIIGDKIAKVLKAVKAILDALCPA
ncbi:hypothetical protein [Allosphingosinicella sp.]|jgi:hypothetical protein|uniref:hypothetical protein n=1 Tax=Allosphingosinicella sp. TaxID=2823234 RepID=UPI002F09B993